MRASLSVSSTLLAGRRAGSGYSDVGIGSMSSADIPAARTAAQANSYYVHEPEFTAW